MRLAIIAITLAFFSADAQVPDVIVVQDMKRDSIMHAIGYKWFVESIAGHLSPRSVPASRFDEKLKQIKSLSTPIYAVNIFLPGNLKVVGPSVNEQAVVAYADTVFQRCKAAGINMIIWGSGGSRRVPDGFDMAKAREQFVSIAKKVAIRAQQYNIDIVLENLNHTETNFINKVSDIVDIAKKVNEPNFKICVDIYHMLMEDESPDVISTTGKYLVHCDIAEKQGRRPPGTNGDDFRPYLRALKAVGYKGKITLECNWQDVDSELKTGKENLERQIREVFESKK